MAIACTHGEPDALEAQISANGRTPGTFSFDPTEAYNTPRWVTIPLVLAAGSNTIRLENPSGAAPDIDVVSVPGAPTG
ncbi:hypothetical protein OHA61_39075 [Streptomyces sp. NBC_00885]|uniref:hypothetical protein n=1 Tax=Streptomyces sp. NBC_00885 TaxID=2975857 RepID=UPI0038643BAE|nr:hypothetical protein OHA61_39075 [Streptomyces sp. NBC_00885]